MRNGFVNLLGGVVTAELTGPYPEQMLNRCIKQGIHIWDVTVSETGSVQFKLQLKHVHRMRKFFRKTDLTLRFKEREGLPFLLKKMRVRAGFVTGIVAFIVGFILLSNIVWGYSIQGASPQVEQKLEEAIEELGVKRGEFIFHLPKPNVIQAYVTDRVDEATWIGVRRKGTNYEFEVVEQVRQVEPEILSPRHLVASKKAVIRSMFVEDGTAIKHTNDVVEKGDLLVSGFIGVEGNEQTIPAKASVKGEIWYTSTVSMPLTQTYRSLTGEQKNKYHLTVGNVSIPFWNFTAPKYDAHQTFRRESDYSILGYRLPFQITVDEQRETLQFEKTYEKAEAIEVLKNQAKFDLKQDLPDDAQIIGEQVLHETVESDKVSLTIHYQVLEEITQEKPIIQGD
ncbi:sporulation protein YqfD [Shouchella sp. 1P09AA]|uniref:sporulation protein YqfD n=1 Tax=unclassified Shouchella TaxID=2893065 RepID=UPI0039A37BE0